MLRGGSSLPPFPAQLVRSLHMSSALSPHDPPAWFARSAENPGWLPAVSSPATINHHWHPLLQHWRTHGVEPGFQSGWAKIQWHPSGLRCEAIFFGAAPQNRARRLNESTWELGDVCEVFLEPPDRTHYLEVHVTPENQRLQLRFTSDGIARARAGAALLEEYMIAQDNWVQSATQIVSDRWSVLLAIPAAALGLRALDAQTKLRTAVCRYDCGLKTEPMLSSTAPLQEPSYHRRQDGQELVLEPARSGTETSGSSNR